MADQVGAVPGPGAVRPQTRKNDHGELQSLCLMDGHDSYRVFVLGQSGRAAFVIAELADGVDQPHEPCQIRTFDGLVLVGETHQLPHVGEPPAPFRRCQKTQVIFKRRHGAIDESREARSSEVAGQSLQDGHRSG